ncbi:carboxypeptidase regulatory-like domain-containing protein [Catellatospora sp. NPDC049133]|uniref:carboxypeptidase regulatory-like domain-containing protein n=1 Tax=Catellatospora sp. NPDC049133 TaxID=3155499 RepID=UPI0033CDCFD0
MRRHLLRRVGIMLLAATVATTGLAAAAHADPDTGTITGRLTDGGQPVANAHVEASGAGFGAAETDANGDYVIADLPPGSGYQVRFNPPGRPWQYAYHTPTYESAAEFTVAAGATTVVNDTLIAVGTITGRFIDAAGNGLPHRTVTFSSEPSGIWQFTETDATGAYQAVLPTGAYRVAFKVGSQDQYVPGKLDHSLAQIFSLAAGQTVTVDETELPLGAVAGRIVRADGTPAAGTDVLLRGPDDGYAGYAGTDADGRYRIDVLSGAYRVMIPFDSDHSVLQYVPGKRLAAEAQLFTVTAGNVTAVDETLLPTGSASGRFTDAEGNGMAGVEVSLIDEYAGTYSGRTDANGDWQVDGLLVGEYSAMFFSWQHNFTQYAYGKTSREAADEFTVTAGQNVVVDDSRLATGSIRITAKNSVTGAPVADFYVQAGSYSTDAVDGVATLSELPVGTWQPAVYASGYQPLEQVAPVTVVAGQQAAIELTLVPYGSLRAKVVDAATGAPVAGVCLFTQTKTKFRLFEGCAGESGADGEVVLDVAAGTYQVFALPGPGSAYGAQWVGLTGGTGSQDLARNVVVAAGERKDIHKIYMDRKGSVTGVVTGADGAPVTSGTVAVVTPVIGDAGQGRVAVDTQGRYTIDFLGPYSWPLSFQTSTHAFQWSGAAHRRQSAILVPVTAGQTTTFDQQLALGALVKVTATGSPAGGFAVAYNNSNGDVAGFVWVQQAGGQAVYRVMGGQQVKLEFAGGLPGQGWYGGTDFDSAKTVSIPTTGEKVVVYPYS